MNSPNDGEFLLYQAPDGHARIQVRLTDGTLWLTQQQLSDLYLSTPQNITQHIRAIYGEGEAVEAATCKPYLQVRNEGGRSISRTLKHYNLDIVLAIGYRVRSHRGSQFRQWATDTLKEYLVKGFAMDDARLKNGADDDYFDELLARIRDIRSSERNLWRKVQDIYTTSIDYDAHNDVSQSFFSTLQNKMHFATHRQTAAELVNQRADASQPHMGLTSWKEAARGGPIRKADVTVAKNYLLEDEIKVLSLIVSQYLDFAELQALERRAMTMAQWVAKLDGFLQLAGRELLQGMGQVSHEQAVKKAELEYEKFTEARRVLDAQLTVDVKVLELARKKLPAPKRQTSSKTTKGSNKL
jgi:hypothetical protein